MIERAADGESQRSSVRTWRQPRLPRARRFREWGNHRLR
jgi:hypothetical protein